MSIPRAIKIRREKGYHTDCIGKYGTGDQFMAFVVAAGKVPALDWYAVLHTFDRKGAHRATQAERIGREKGLASRRDLVAKAQARLDAMLAALGPLKHANVKVALFEVAIDGHRFGLVDESEPGEDVERVVLWPNDLAFFAPWDGSYST